MLEISNNHIRCTRTSTRAMKTLGNSTNYLDVLYLDAQIHSQQGVLYNTSQFFLLVRSFLAPLREENSSFVEIRNTHK